MLAQILNQDLLLDAAEDTRRELRTLLDKRERRAADRDEGPLVEIDSEDIREVMQELAAAMDRTAAQTAAKDASMCMPREPLLAILQSELENVSRDQRPDASEPDPEGITERRIADIDITTRADGRRAFGRFEVTRPKFLSDPRWVWSGVVIGWHKFKKKAAFGGLPDGTIQVADNARILLVGDWGSGIPRAQKVSQQMRAELERGKAEGVEQHVIHLGDVYYTGAEQEYKERFLPHWPVKRGEDIGSYTLVGNHDMYRGGHSYYDTALQDARFKDSHQGKSVFALQSPSWLLLGLDSGYEDDDLYGNQPEWIRARQQAASGHRTALLTHHQLFSAYEDAGEKLRKRLQSVLADGVDAWFWAHEHRCLVYDKRADVGFASCVGHGGIPEYLIGAEGEPYPQGLRYDYRKKHGTSIEPWNTFGFAALDLKGRAMTVRYIDEDGKEHHKEVIAP